MSPRRFSAPIDGQVRLMTKVARMYHENGMLQSEIARTLSLSQAKVSRLLKRASKVGIVRTTVIVAPGLHAELEDALESTYGLREALVVDVDPDADEDEAIAAIAGGAASYLEEYISGGTERIGISSWSRTLNATVNHMRASHKQAAALVVQMLGGSGARNRQNDAQRMLTDLASVLGAEPISVNAPGVVTNEAIRDALMQEAPMQEVQRHWRELTLALVGIGTVEPSNVLVDSGNTFSPEDRSRLIAEGAVGNVCHNYFTADGTYIDEELAKRTIAISTEDFLRIPRRIAVAGGPPKRDVIKAALEGKWVNVLITDSATASYLLDR